jgi:hypothetical protein
VTTSEREFRRLEAQQLRRLAAAMAHWLAQLAARLRAAGVRLHPRRLPDVLRAWGAGLRAWVARVRLAGTRLPAHEQRQLIVLTLVLATGLLALLGASLRAGGGWPGIPALVPPLFVTLQPRPTATPDPRATPVPTRSIFWWFSGTPQLGEEDDATPAAPSAADEYVIYMPLIAQNEPTVGRLPATQEPEPPPVEPTPNWPNGLNRLTNSKLGIHTVTNNDPYIMEYIRRSRPRVVKAVDDLGWLAEVAQVSPNTILIGRLNSDQDESTILTMPPEEAADAYIAKQLERYRLNPAVDYWEGWNEFVPVSNERMAWYARFEARRACAMEDLGLRAAVGGFSVGVPEYEQMLYFLPALEAAYNCNGIFTLHEYNSPDMRCLTDSNQAGIIPGAPQINGTLVGPLTLRYRFWYEGLLKPRGMGSLPLVISELGIANILTIADCNDPGGDGWHGYSDYLVDQYGPTAAEGYVKVLGWYDDEMLKDDYVWGATIFTAGSQSNAHWRTMDIHEALVPLAHYSVGK